MPSRDASPPVHPETVQRIARRARITPTYLVLMGVSGVLAAVAFLTDSVPLLVGSMVVAPTLPPLALVAFAFMGRQPHRVLRGLGSVAVGLLMATAFSMIATGLLNLTNVLPPEANLLDKPLLEERVNPGWYSAVAALAAGIAGAIALAKDQSEVLVGVVASLALVPAAAAAGIALLSGDPVRGLGGLLMLGINVGVATLAAMVTLLLIRPDQTD